jgi:hypothetical protein
MINYPLDSLSFFKFTFAINSGILFWKLLLFKYLLSISENFPCSISALQVKTVLLLDALHLIMLFVGMMAYVEPKMFLLIIF